MPFFIRTRNSIKQNAKIMNKSFKGKKRKFEGAVKKSKKRVEDDEEIDSDEEEKLEAGGKHGRTKFAPDSDEDRETAQEKKLRLAKIYLEEIERKEKRLRENREVAKEDITNYLKEELKEKASKNRKAVADTYNGYDETNVKILSCKDHYLPLTCLVISFDNEFIYSGSKDSNIVKWELNSGKKLKSVKDIEKADGSKKSSRSILCIAISSDGKFLVTGSSKSLINVWNPETLGHLHTFSGHTDAVTGLAFQRNRHTLFSASSDKSVKVWNLTEMTYVESLFGHQKGITAVDALLAERAITSGEDNSIHLWKIVEETQLIYNAKGVVDGVKYINEEYFLSCGADGLLCCWGVLKKRPLCVIPDAHGIDEINKLPNWITSIATLVNTDLVASGSSNGVIKLWKCSDGFKKLELVFEVPVKGFINCLHFTSDGKYLVAAVGSEHRMGRWWKMKEVKNHVHVVPLIKKS